MAPKTPAATPYDLARTRKIHEPEVLDRELPRYQMQRGRRPRHWRKQRKPRNRRRSREPRVSRHTSIEINIDLT